MYDTMLAVIFMETSINITTNIVSYITVIFMETSMIYQQDYEGAGLCE